MRLKLLTMGEVRVGKTALLKRYRWDYHCTVPSISCRYIGDKHNVEYEATLGVDFFEALKPRGRDEDGNSVRVVSCFYDLSGDITFLKVRSEFYQDFHGVLLVFDVTSRQSFERLEHWLGEAAKFGNGKPISNCVVCGNKSDLANERDVTAREAKTWALSKGFQYFETSARGGHNVSKSIDALIDACKGDSQFSKFSTRPTTSSKRNSQANSNRGSTSSNSSNNNSRNSSSTAQGTGKARDPSSMSVKELKNELERMNAGFQDCLEKADFVKRYQEVMAKREQYREQQAQQASEKKEKRQQEEAQDLVKEKTKDQVLKQVEDWARGKDIRQMLNTLLEYKSEDPRYLSRQCAVAPVGKAYKKAVLKIHPDKADSSNLVAHAKATEMFKTVNAAFELFKKANETRLNTPPEAQNQSRDKQTSRDNQGSRRRSNRRK